MNKILLIILLTCFQLYGHEKFSHEPNKINVQAFKELFPNEENEGIFDMFSPPISQNLIIENMIHYLKLHNRDITVVNKNGVCNGLAFLAQYYANMNREDEFFKILKKLANWNKKKSSLSKATGIPGIANLGMLFEQWINDITWFQQTYIQIESFPTLEISNQRKRNRQFQMIKDLNDNRKITLLSSPITYPNINQKQLHELLTIWSCYPNTILEFGGSRHATSAKIFSDRSIFYYDPNYPKRIKPTQSIDKIVKVIQQYKYENLGFPSNEMSLEVMAYQYTRNKGLPIIPHPITAIQSMKTGKDSPNGFTPLHIAIYANDLNNFSSLLNKQHLNPNEADIMGITPLYLSTQMWKLDFLLELLKQPGIDINYQTHFSPILGAITNFNLEAAVLLINHGTNLFLTTNNKQTLNEVLNTKATLELFHIPAVILANMQELDEMNFVVELCKRVPDLLKKEDGNGLTVKDYAALFGNKTLFSLLNEPL